MLKLLSRYLKPHLLSIAVIILLLFAQANLDLQLPDYMSDIVNNGISNQGIADTGLIALTPSLYNKMQLFIEDDDLALINENYLLIDKGSPDYLELYPLLANQSLYLLDSPQRSITKAIGDIWYQPLLIVLAIESQQIDLSEYHLPTTENPFPQIATLNFSQRQLLMRDILDNLDENDFTALITSRIKSEYDLIGLDTQQLQRSYIYSAGIRMLVVTLISSICAVLVSLLSARAGANVAYNLRNDVFTKVESFSSSEFNQFSTASLITRTTNDITQMQMVITMMFRFVFYAPILGIGALIKMLNSDTGMVWIIGLAVVLVGVLIFVAFVFVLPKFKLIQILIDNVNLVARENLTGLLVVRAFGREKYEEARFDLANKKLAKTQLFVNRSITTLLPIMNMIMSGLILSVVWFGGQQVASGQLMVGNLMAFIQYAMQIIMSFIFIAMIFVFLPRAAVSAERIVEVLDTELSIVDPPSPLPFKANRRGEVVFNKVFFKYPQAETYALMDISFVARPKEITAIVGGTGAGKSTLVSLIPRLYEASQGVVGVDGVDVKAVNQQQLRDKIGFIPQKAVLFSGTISENLTYGSNEINENQLITATKIAQAYDFIIEKPEKFDEEVAQAGSNLSGGQKQRLAIARALVKNPDIFIFDDSFSALDFQTDAALRQALRTQLGDKTVIIVTQRISTIMDANQILVLNEGKIVGRGTHQQLLKSCDVYREIASSQLNPSELAYE